jgi:hypothetical protein
MTNATLPPDQERARLAPLLLDAWRQIRRLRLILQLANERRRALSDALRTAVALLAEQNETIDRLRDQVTHLRAQVRAAVSGRTIAAERQAIDDGDQPDRAERAA